jgi:hypothetical protein
MKQIWPQILPQLPITKPLGKYTILKCFCRRLHSCNLHFESGKREDFAPCSPISQSLSFGWSGVPGQPRYVKSIRLPPFLFPECKWSFSLQIQGEYNGKRRNSLISLIAVILFSMKTIKNAGER